MAMLSAFERPAVRATACSQSKRTGPVVVGGKVNVLTERSRALGQRRIAVKEDNALLAPGVAAGRPWRAFCP